MKSTPSNFKRKRENKTYSSRSSSREIRTTVQLFSAVYFSRGKQRGLSPEKSRVLRFFGSSAGAQGRGCLCSPCSRQASCTCCLPGGENKKERAKGRRLPLAHGVRFLGVGTFFEIQFLGAVDPPAKSLPFWWFSGKAFDFPKSSSLKIQPNSSQ